MRLYRIFLLVCILLSGILCSQPAILDPCFSSGTPGTSFVSTTNLADVGSNSDLCQWTGSAWTGGWSGASLTKPPPVNSAGCRAIWCGSGTAWTTGGEGFGVKLSSGLVTGVAYSFSVTYVSHGTGSTGAFNPIVYTNSTPAVGGTSLGNMPAVGTNWTTNMLNFTATAAQNGHTWLIIGTWPSYSSGFVNSFCSTCNVTVLPIELINFDVKLNKNREVNSVWSTASEKDHKYFVLQHSSDAQNFSDIATINGAGNSDQVHNYSYLDKTPYNGISYYRLKLISTEGVVSYSEMRSADLNYFAKLKLYPNPTNGILHIPVMDEQALFSENSEMEVLNYLGNVMIKQNYSGTLDVTFLPSGYYHLKIKNPEGDFYTYKFSKE